VHAQHTHHPAVVVQRLPSLRLLALPHEEQPPPLGVAVLRRILNYKIVLKITKKKLGCWPNFNYTTCGCCCKIVLKITSNKLNYLRLLLLAERMMGELAWG
jgi:hypothetical protein